jgi:hypothetical protein
MLPNLNLQLCVGTGREHVLLLFSCGLKDEGTKKEEHTARVNHMAHHGGHRRRKAVEATYNMSNWN